MNAKNRKPEFAIIAASLEGMNFCLVKHTPFADEGNVLWLYSRNGIAELLTHLRARNQKSFSSKSCKRRNC